jgi:hypothetical protein
LIILTLVTPKPVISFTFGVKLDFPGILGNIISGILPRASLVSTFAAGHCDVSPDSVYPAHGEKTRSFQPPGS